MKEDFTTPEITLQYIPSGWALQASLADTLFWVSSLNGYMPEKIKLVPFVSETTQWATRFRVGDVFQALDRYYKVVKMDIGSNPHIILEKTVSPNAPKSLQSTLFESRGS